MAKKKEGLINQPNDRTSLLPLFDRSGGPNMGGDLGAMPGVRDESQIIEAINGYEDRLRKPNDRSRDKQLLERIAAHEAALRSGKTN